MSARLAIGIDPGLNGGVAFVWNDGVWKDGCPGAVKMPSTRLDILQLMSEMLHKPDAVAVVEKVHSMPRQGVASSFKFGMMYERACFAVQAAGIKLIEATPREWQKGLGIPSRKKIETPTQWKNRLRAKAQELFPGVNVTLYTADALLIAEYCRRTQL